MCFITENDISLQSIGSCGFDTDVLPMSYLSQSESPACFISDQLGTTKKSHNILKDTSFLFT